MAAVPAIAGLAGAAALLTVSFAAVAGGAVVSQRLAGAADAAALAAADAASGAVTGAPCERAAEIARVAGFSLRSCDVAGLIATVTLSGGFGGIDVEASARAGPPS